MLYVSKTLEETNKIAKNFIETLLPKSTAVTVAFYGDLGAGKTTFIQALAKEMGIEEPTTSPTFVIQKSYKTPLKPDKLGQVKYFDTLIHIDAYRLESGLELSKLNFDETLKMPKTLICIEWPSNVESVLPKDVIKVDCKFIDETTRKYNF